MSNNGLYDNLRKFIDVIDKLRDNGLDKYIQLPRIVVLGSQSSGKSSLLESIVGIDFLPRGEGVVTRRPLELRLVRIKDQSQKLNPYAIFEELKGQKFTEFVQVKKTIELLTEKVAGANKGIIDNPIILTIYSQTCPDLTVVDLPGITRIPMMNSDQREDIEKVTVDMATRYCADPRTIILCVVPANADISTSDALMIARKLDKEGDRTLGVLTKIDIMDKGTSAKEVLLNKAIPLKLGYVGVKNRSQYDINNNMVVQNALEEEQKYFSNHPIYSSMSQGYLGTQVLITKLSDLFYKHVSQIMPSILTEIDQKMRETNEKLELLGTPLPSTDQDRMQMLWDLVSKFAVQFKSSIQGKFNKTANIQSVPEGAKIRIIFNDIYLELSKNFQKTSSRYNDKDIQRAIKLHEGDSLSGFQSIDAFFYLLHPLLMELKDPAIDCVFTIQSICNELANKIINKLNIRYPTLKAELEYLIMNYFETVKEDCRIRVEDYLEAEINYIHTNDDRAQNTYLELLGAVQGDNQADAQTLLIKEMRNKIDTYFEVVVRLLRDMIPKMVGNFFVKKVEDHLQMYLVAELQNNSEIRKNIKEPESVTIEREKHYQMINVLKDCQKFLKKDARLMDFITSQK